MAMDLDTVFQAFVNVQTIIICLAIYLLTYVIRKVVEGAWKGARIIESGGKFGFLLALS